jgi:integrase
MISTVIKRLEERAEIKHLIKDQCHIFRRTWAWRQVQAGVPEKDILLAAGWESRAMLDRYIGAATSREAIKANWKE